MYFVKAALGNNTKVICCLSTSLHIHIHTHTHTHTHKPEHTYTHVPYLTRTTATTETIKLELPQISSLNLSLCLFFQINHFKKSLGGDYKCNVEIQMCLTMRCVHMHVQSLQSCLTLCDSMDCNLPGSSIHGILHARILEWVAVPSLRGSSQLRDWTRIFCITEWFFTSEPGKYLLTNTGIQ